MFNTLLVMAIIFAVAHGQRAKDNGDIYVVNVTKFLQDKQDNAPMPVNASIVVGIIGEVYNDAYDDSSSSISSVENAAITADNRQAEQQQQQMANVEDAHNFDDVIAQCNASFSIPMESLIEFNNTGALIDEVDKTGLCFIRCYYEKMGLIDKWQLNVQMIRDTMWPATGDSIDFCQNQGKNETNACVRTYAIAKCLMVRAIVDARNKPVV